MDVFDFEELLADMFDITDEQRDENPDLIEERFCEEFDTSLESGFKLATALLKHTPPVQAGLSEKQYHAFVSKSQPVMLMKAEVNES